jgi:hypothetical protein
LSIGTWVNSGAVVGNTCVNINTGIVCICLYKNLIKTGKTNFRGLAIEEPIFAVANAEFESGYYGHGFGDCIVLVLVTYG